MIKDNTFIVMTWYNDSINHVNKVYRTAQKDHSYLLRTGDDSVFLLIELKDISKDINNETKGECLDKFALEIS